MVGETPATTGVSLTCIVGITLSGVFSVPFSVPFTGEAAGVDDGEAVTATAWVSRGMSIHHAAPSTTAMLAVKMLPTSPTWSGVTIRIACFLRVNGDRFSGFGE